MWFFIILSYFLIFTTTKIDSNQSFDNIEQNLLTGLQMISNSSLNSSLIENQIPEQILSNTSLIDLQNDNNTQQLQIRFRERKRQERLLIIQSQILQRLGISGRNINSSNMNSFSDEEKNLMNRVVNVSPTPRTRTVAGVNEISSSEIFAERLQSFYPSCAVPNHTDPVLWNLNSDLEMKLFYDITFPRSAESRTEVTALSAKLRVFKFNDPPKDRTTPEIGNTVTDRVYRILSEEGLTISLYQYMRPLRQNRREKKRLLDSRTVSWNKRGYIEFNIINAINYWQNNPIRNFGLFIEIEDPYGGRHNPQLYLSQMNCSVADTPMPNLAEIYPEVNNESSVLNEDNFPTLDLLTVEVVKQQPIASNSTRDVSLRRKRVAVRPHKHLCQMTKTEISIKDLDLEETILYPSSLKTVTCKGFCHKHQANHYECKPSDYKDIKFVFLDQNSNPIIKRVKKLLPQNCQCIKINKT